MKEPVPPGWDPEVWYRHLQNLEWQKAMGVQFSLTDPVRVVEKFKQKVVREFAESSKITRFSPDDLTEGGVLERAILKRIETIDLSKADVVVLRSESSPEGIDQLVVAQLAKTIRQVRGKDGIVLLLRPNEGLEALSLEDARRKLLEKED